MVDQMSIGPDDVMSLSELPLTPYEREAKAHWERFLPKTCKALNRQSPTALDLTIRKMYHAMEYQIARHLAERPTLHRDQVSELYRPLLFPPPEPPTTPDRDTPTTT